MTADRPHAARAALVVGATAALFYLLLSSAAPRWGDAADLARRAVAEPLAPYGRSYPLQAALARLVDAVVGDPARSMTIVTSLAAGAGVGLLHFTCCALLGCSRWAAFAAAGAWAFSHTYWSAAVDGETYALLGAFAVAALAVVLAARDAHGSPRVAYAAGLLVGLMLLHHRASLFAAPVVLLAPIIAAQRGTRGAVARRVVVALLLGALPFVALVWREAWLAPDGLSVELLSAVLVGTPRNAELLIFSQRPLLASIAYVARWTLFNLPGPALPLAAVGTVALWRRDRGAATLAAALVLAALVLPLRLDVVGDRYVFLVGVYPVAALAVGLGVDRIARCRPRVPVPVALCCALSAPIAYAALALSEPGRDLLSGLRPQAARDFLLPVRTGDPGSRPWVTVAARALRGRDRVYAEWGAAAALDYAREIEGVLPALEVVRRPPSREEIATAGVGGVVVALTPIWSDDRVRLPSQGAAPEAIGPALYRVRPAE